MIRMNVMPVRIRTVTMSERGQIVIPEDMRKDLRLSGKEALVLIERGNELLMRKESDVASNILRAKPASEKMSSALLSEKALAKEWLSKEEDLAWRHL